jgi:hypothetical protein
MSLRNCKIPPMSFLSFNTYYSRKNLTPKEDIRSFEFNIYNNKRRKKIEARRKRVESLTNESSKQNKKEASELSHKDAGAQRNLLNLIIELVFSIAQKSSGFIVLKMQF